MIIAQGSIDVDENALLAQSANDQANQAASNSADVGNQLTIFKNDMSAAAQELRAKYTDSIKQMDTWRDETTQAQDKLTQELQSNYDDLTDEQAKIKASISETQFTSEGKVTISTEPPTSDNDKNVGHHQNGDLWIQQIPLNAQGKIDYDSFGQPIRKAGSMFHYYKPDDGSQGHWIEQRWDQEILSVENLSALSADLGEVNAGTISGVTIEGTTFSSALSGDSNYTAGDWGHNPTSWETYGFNANDLTSPGMHIGEGLFRMKGQRRLDSPSGDGGKWDFTFIAPNEVKVRESVGSTTDKNNITDRADLTSSWVEIGNSYYTPATGHAKDSYTGCGLYSDGTAVISNILYTTKIEGGGGGKHVTINSKLETPYRIETPGWDKPSDLSLKNVKSQFNNRRALAEVNGTDVYNYFYKGNNDDKNIGPIIDDIHNINQAEYNVSEYMLKRDDNGKDFFSVDNTVGLLIGAVNELTSQNEKLLGKITQLEAKVNGNY